MVYASKARFDGKVCLICLPWTDIEFRKHEAAPDFHLPLARPKSKTESSKNLM